MTDVSHILDAIADGDPQAAGQLLPLVYDQLRRLAVQKLAQEKPGQTLQATALVHEAYLKVAGADGNRCWKDTGHFFRALAIAAVKYGSNLLEVTARCSKHCAILHFSGNGFQLSCPSLSPDTNCRAASLFFSASSKTVCRKFADSKNNFIALNPHLQNAAPAFSIVSYVRVSRIFFISSMTRSSSSSFV